MNTSQEILNFLTKDENVGIALEVSQYIENLKRQTHHDFWVSMNQTLAMKLETELRGRWVLQKFPINQLRGDWKTASIQMRTNQENVPHLPHFQVGQDSQEKNYQLFCGVVQSRVDGVSLTALRGLLVSMGLGFTSEYWAGWGHLPVMAFTPEFISGVHNQRDAYVQKVANMVWERFDRVRPELEAINQELLKNQP